MYLNWKQSTSGAYSCCFNWDSRGLFDRWSPWIDLWWKAWGLQLCSCGHSALCRQSPPARYLVETWSQNQDHYLHLWNPIGKTLILYLRSHALHSAQSSWGFDGWWLAWVHKTNSISWRACSLTFNRFHLPGTQWQDNELTITLSIKMWSVKA